MIETTQVGDWQKISDLGSGAFGVVSLWKNNSSNDFVAIKKCKFMLPTHLSAKQKERWKKEVEMIHLIKHPNIVSFKQIPAELEAALLKQNPSKLPLMPMEYCKHGNLRRLLYKWKNISGLDEQDVRTILEDVSKGLEHLHRLNITHRDIKPENIVIQNSDDRVGGYIYKIIDLGYAKELSDTVVSFVGTLHYLAPEIFETETYTKSVDYWSLGLLTFEIICGVLPFLPQLTPVERYSKIKDKAADDICIFMNYSGRISCSNEIRKENFISLCLKQNIEVWLRHVLQYDKNLRSQPFPNGTNVFEYLQDVLKKTIINIVSLCKLERYSYEVNDSTLLGTLKDWICRDIKASRNEIVLLSDKKFLLTDDLRVLVDLVGQETNIYVIKKHTSIVSDPMFNFPKLVKEAVNSAMKFNKDFIRALCAQTIYFIKTEKNLLEHFKTGFSLYLRYLFYNISELRKNSIVADKNLTRLLENVQSYNEVKRNNVCDMYLDDNSEYKDCLNHNRRLLASLERCLVNSKVLEERICAIRNRSSILESCRQEIDIIFEQYDLSSQYSDLLDLFEKKEANANVHLVTALTRLVSSTIKFKQKLLTDRKLCAFSDLAASVLRKCDRLSSWLESFNTHITDLSVCFEQNQIIHQNIICSVTEDNKCNIESNTSFLSLNEDLTQLSSLSLTEDNWSLRNRLEDLISTSIQAHNSFSKVIQE